MRWPWVARSTLDAVEGERDRLRDQVDRLMDTLTGIKRRELGLPEKPREPRDKMPAIPVALYEEISGFSDGRTRKMMEAELHRRYAVLGSWEAVLAERQAVESIANGNGDEP